MALLATLEGESGTISLNDLFDVNDFLGVRYFGPENWNRIKKCACIITSNASNSPVIFWLDSLKNDYPQPSELSKCLFGFNDRLGARCMGAPAWNAVKSKIDAELLGLSIGSIASSIGSGLKKAGSVVKTVATAPLTIGEKVWTETPLKYTPGGKLVSFTQKARQQVSEPITDAAQMVTDKTSQLLYTAATQTPLKYTGTGQLIAATEKAREAAGVTSAGTADVYETQEEINAKKRAAAEAAAKAASAASAKQAQSLAAAKKLKAEKEQTAAAQAEAIAAQQEAAATQTALEHANETLSSKYAPWILGGAGLLVALSILKK